MSASIGDILHALNSDQDDHLPSYFIAGIAIATVFVAVFTQNKVGCTALTRSSNICLSLAKVNSKRSPHPTRFAQATGCRFTPPDGIASVKFKSIFPRLQTNTTDTNLPPLAGITAPPFSTLLPSHRLVVCRSVRRPLTRTVLPKLLRERSVYVF